jgi:hypothetical protein
LVKKEEEDKNILEYIFQSVKTMGNKLKQRTHKEGSEGCGVEYEHETEPHTDGTATLFRCILLNLCSEKFKQFCRAFLHFAYCRTCPHSLLIVENCEKKKS